MVTRTHKTVRITYTPPSYNPGYGWLRQVADTIIEVSGAVEQSAATGNITLTIPDYPGTLYLSASSSGSNVTVSMRKSGSSTSLVAALTLTCSNNMSVRYEAVGDFLHLLSFSAERSAGAAYLAWAWFVGEYTEQRYYYLYSGSVSNALPSIMPDLSARYTTSSSTQTWICAILPEDLSDRYVFSLSGRASGGPYQPSNSYPLSHDAKILCPYAATCGITTEGIPNPGYCKWGGAYMLYALCGWGSYTPVTVEPGVNYRVNGKNYVACGSTLIIPEPWPFKEA